MPKPRLNYSKPKSKSNYKNTKLSTYGKPQEYVASASLIRRLSKIPKRGGPITAQEKARTKKFGFSSVSYLYKMSKPKKDNFWYFIRGLKYKFKRWFPRYPKNIIKNRASKPYFLLDRASHKTYFLSKMREYLKRDFRKHGWLYRFRIDEKYVRPRKMSKFLLKKLRLMRIRLFYGIFSHKKFVKLLKTKKARANHFQTHLFTLMETRLDVILYKGCFCQSIYTAQQLVRHGHVSVDGKVVKNLYYSVKLYSKVSFSTKETLIRMQYNYLMQLRLKRLHFLPAPYLVVNYLYMFIFVRPLLNARKEVALPYKLKSRHLSIR